MSGKCKGFDVLITRFIDGELDQSDRRRVETHLEECRTCKENYLQEIEVKKLIKHRLSKVKAPSYLKNRIRRVLFRRGDRPGFWQLVHSLFAYRPVTTSIVLAAIALMMILPTLQNFDRVFGLFGPDMAKTQLLGNIICLDCEFSKNIKKVEHDPSSHRHGLKSEDGRIWTFVDSGSYTELLRNPDLLSRMARINGIVFRRSQYIYVQEYEIL